MTYAKVIEDSISEDGHRLTTMEVRFHRFVLAEFNTHRVFSRNSASSRAIPLQKQLDRMEYDLAVPLEWRTEQRGMQGGERLSPEDERNALAIWNDAAHSAKMYAKQLGLFGVHKSVANRLLEPFMWHRVIVTSTAWQNFFDQRVSELAQPEIRAAAELMLDTYEESTPKPVPSGGYHLPYIREEDWDDVESRGVPDKEALEGMIKVSVARCARVSYLTHDGKRDLDKDIELYNRLVSARPMHASPLEHVASPAGWNSKRTFAGLRPKVGNFVGWIQHRHMVEEMMNMSSYR